VWADACMNFAGVFEVRGRLQTYHDSESVWRLLNHGPLNCVQILSAFVS
jgi:hypothetical protein